MANNNWMEIGVKCVESSFAALRNLKENKTLDQTSNPHTNADLVSHAAIVECLQKAEVSCDLISEEHQNGQSAIKINNGGAQVFVDPIDGSVHYLIGELSFCAVGLFVVENSEPACSFVGDLATGDIYSCDKSNAYKNGAIIKVPKNIEGKKIIAGWGTYGARGRKFCECFAKLPQDKYLMFNFGAMLQSAKIANGNYDACVEFLPAKLQEFAGAIIAQRAGAILSTLEGAPIKWDGGIKQTMLVSRDEAMHGELVRLFR